MASRMWPSIDWMLAMRPSKITKSIMKSYRVQIPKYEMPLRLRPWFLAFTCIIMLILAFLGFTNFSHSLPVNDKMLHFICFCIATAVFYFVIDVEEESRRIWFWRHSNLILTAFICLFCGGIISEFVQAVLPYKEFQFGDVLANLSGSCIGLFVAYHSEKYYRRRREIARLYRPLGTEPLSDIDEDEDPLAGTQLLPTHNNKAPKIDNGRLADVWDEQEDIFSVGADEDDDH